MLTLLLAASILVFNEDDSNYIRDVPKEEFVRYFDSVCRGAVTHFFMCPNAMRSNVESKFLEPIWTALDEPGVDPKWGRAAKALHDKGIDPYAIWSARAREKGVSPWLTVRMNDIHGVDDPSFPSLCTLWRKHPELRRVPSYRGGDWAPYAFDYAHKEVRDRMVGFIGELLAKYDVDGLETDWLRFPWHLAPGREREDAHCLTELMREVRKLADAAAKRLGHPVRVGARVATNREDALALGTDAEAWAADRSIDWLVVCNFFSSVDPDCDYADWAKRIHAVNPDVTIVPGLDSGVRKEGLRSPRRLLTLPEYRGLCERLYAQGAPGVYIFNPFHFDEKSEIWSAILGGGLSPSAVAAGSRAYPTSYRDCAGDGMGGCAKTPRNLAEGDVTITLDIGRPLAAGTCDVLLGFAAETVDEGLLKHVTLNGATPLEVESVSKTDWLHEKSSAKSSFRLTFPPTAPIAGANAVRLPKTEGKLVVTACELELFPAKPALKSIVTAPHELDVLLKAGHVQGVCCSEKAIYLTHACGIEKLDWQGRHLKHADAPAHLGDCFFKDGRIYGAFVLRGAKKGEQPGMVRVWDEDLNVVAERKFDDIFGSVGILGDTIYLGITRPNGKPHPGLDLQLLDLSLNPKGRVTVDIGYSIAYGAQVISTDGKDLLVGVYGAGKDKGNPNRYNFTVLSPDLRVRRNLTFGCAEGLALVPPAVTGRTNPVFMVVKALNGNMKKWRQDPEKNPPQVRLDFYEYADGAFRPIGREN